VLVDPAGEAALTALDTELAGRPVDYAQLVHDCKREVTDGMLGSEVARLVRVIGELPGVDAAQQTEALAELLASLPGLPQLPARRPRAPRRHGGRRPRAPSRPGAAVDALHPVLAQAGTEAATRFEQTSGPVMAKGVEDSAYYRWARFVALNEVGGDPARFGSTVEEFHEAQQRRPSASPQSMTTLSTHDTKRSEDVRARLAVLAELPDRVGAAGARLLARHPLADRPLAHLVWQNLVGAWPLSRERAHAYVEKAAREAGHLDDLDRPGAGVRGAAARAGRRRLRRRGDGGRDRRVRRADRAVRLVELAGQKLLQLTMPGVPDVYQGTELWDYSLVDPDNRRPVDYDLRREAAGRARRGRGARRSTRPARPSCWWSPAPCGPAATTPSGSPGTSRSR
jgi:(1->4)-alpha-D-glucan 1-alpha-D-glucosylmutase